jgi:pilus assembly protein CpaC
MKRAFPLTVLLAIGLLGATMVRTTLAQSSRVSQLDTRTLRGAQPVTEPPAESYPAAPMPRTITLEAGTGMLLRLPEAASTVMSAEPAIARVQPTSPTTLFLMGVAQGRTTVIALGDNGTPIGQYDIVVSPGVGRAPAAAAAPAVIAAPRVMPISAESARAIQLSIHRSVPGSASVTVQGAGGRLLLRGAVPNALAAQQIEAIARGIIGDEATIIDTMVVLSSIQVNVRVRIAEIDRTLTRQLGFNWQALGAGGNWRFGVLTGAAAGAIGAVPAFGALAPGALTSGTNPLQSLGIAPFQGAASGPVQLGAGYTSGTRDINGIIDALAADQLVTILAEPNLTAQSGETASFLAGGEFPIPISGNTSNGATTVTVEFKQFGVSLALVPTVLTPNRLNLRIRPEVSQLSTNGAVSVPIGTGTLSIPALTVRRAETTVELGSGQSFAIAGLLERTTTDVTNALPGIGEVPVIGALFKSNNFQRGESELVIIVTPYLVKPIDDPADVHAPTDGFRPPNDIDRLLSGRQMAPQPTGPPQNAGFMLK